MGTQPVANVSPEVGRYVELLRQRGPLALWELSAIVELESYRLKERIDPLVETGWLLTEEIEGRTFYVLAEEGRGTEEPDRGGRTLIDMAVSLVRPKHTFEPVAARTSLKRKMVESCTYKKLITEAYVLTLDTDRYSEKERIRVNLVVEKDLRKIKDLDDKKLYLADFIYEKALGKGKDYFAERNLIHNHGAS